jgi:hypothetical protein
LSLSSNARSEKHIFLMAGSGRTSLPGPIHLALRLIHENFEW